MDFFGITLKPTLTRCDNKLGVVEQKNAVVRILIQRIVQDARYYRQARNATICRNEIIARVMYLNNILYGSKILSSFEMVRGYTPRSWVSRRPNLQTISRPLTLKKSLEEHWLSFRRHTTPPSSLSKTSQGTGRSTSSREAPNLELRKTPSSVVSTNVSCYFPLISVPVGIR